MRKIQLNEKNTVNGKSPAFENDTLNPLTKIANPMLLVFHRTKNKSSPAWLLCKSETKNLETGQTILNRRTHIIHG